MAVGRLWGVACLSSFGAHGALVVGGWMAISPWFDRIDGLRRADRDEVVVSIESETPSEAAAPEPTASPPPTAGHRPLVRRRPSPGLRARRPQPIPVAPTAAPAVGEAPLEAAVDEELAIGEAPETHEGEGALAGTAAPAAAPAPVSPPPPPLLPPSVAAYLRIHDVYPSLPESLRGPAGAYELLLRICVGGDGRVADVHLVYGAAPQLDRVVISAVRTWRYRVRLIQGAPAPFCHLMKFGYSMR